MKKYILSLILLANFFTYGNESGYSKEESFRASISHNQEHINFKNKNKYVEKEVTSTDGLSLKLQSITKRNLFKTYFNKNDFNGIKTVELGVSFLKKIHGYDSLFFGLGLKNYNDINFDKYYNFSFEKEKELGLLTLWSLDSNQATFNCGFGLYNSFNKGVSIQGEIELRLKLIKYFDLFSLYQISERKFGGESQINHMLDVGLGFNF